MLSMARAAQERTMLQTAYIRRSSVFDDPAGGTSSTVAFLGPYQCRVGVARLQRGEEIIAGQLRGRIPFTVTLPALTEVQQSDLIGVGSAIVGNEFVGGTVYEVLGKFAPHTFETARNVLCAER